MDSDTDFGWQQLEAILFRSGSKRGVELALDGGDASLLGLPSVGVRVVEDVSVSGAWAICNAFSTEHGLTRADRLVFFWIRLLPATEAVVVVRFDGHAHSEDLGMV